MFLNRLLVSFAKGNGGLVLGACLLETIIALIDIVVTLCTAFIIWMLLGFSISLPFSELWQPLLCIGVLFCVRFILAGVKARVANSGSICIKESLRNRMIAKVFDLGPAFLSKERTGEIADAISNKVEWLSNYYVIYLPTCAAALVSAVVSISILLAFDTIVACVCIVVVIAILLCPMLFYRLMRARGEAEWQAHSNYYSDCLDSIQGITTLKAFNANRKRAAYVHEKGEELRHTTMHHMKATMVETAAFEFFVRIGGALAIAVSAMRFMDGAMTSDRLVLVLFLSSACFSPFANLGNAWHMGYRGVTATYSIDRILKIKPLVSAALGSGSENFFGQIKLTSNEGVRFQNVRFSYGRPEDEVLHDVSFDVPVGTMTALVGASGSGKSTMAHLLAGFYFAQSGTISLAGERLTSQTLPSIQAQVAAVWQDSHVFYGTVAENITIGKPDASTEEVMEAARKASLHDFVMSLPHGYDTHLGENGMRFSGGERQRIVLARAFLRDSPFIIFDEVTSSLDRKNEVEVQKGFERLRKDKTVLAIAHRLSTIQSAEQICVVESGRIVAFGTHAELLDTSSHYQELMGSQAAESGGDIHE